MNSPHSCYMCRASQILAFSKDTYPPCWIFLWFPEMTKTQVKTKLSQKKPLATLFWSMYCYFSVTLTNTTVRGDLWKEECIWDDGSRGRAVLTEIAWQQEASSGSLELTSHWHTENRAKGKWGEGIHSQSPLLNGFTSSSKVSSPKNSTITPRHHHQCGDEYLSLWGPLLTPTATFSFMSL